MKVIMTTSTKQAKLLKALRSGKELTTKQVANFGYLNPTAAISNLRTRQMISVYGNKCTLRDGSVVTKYRIVTPTRAMARAGYTV